MFADEIRVLYNTGCETKDLSDKLFKIYLANRQLLLTLPCCFVSVAVALVLMPIYLLALGHQCK